MAASSAAAMPALSTSSTDELCTAIAMRNIAAAAVKGLQMPSAIAACEPGQPERTSPIATCGRTSKICVLSAQAAGAVRRDFGAAGPSIKAYLEALRPADLQNLSAQAHATGHAEVEVGNGRVQLLSVHLELQWNQAVLAWARVRNGRLAAAGAPSEKAVREWAREGATCVVSLLKDEEPAFASSRKACEALGLRWEHRPLSGKRAVTGPSAADLESWGGLAGLMPRLLDDGYDVVLHCAAGMHRTGTVAYRTLRTCGFSAEEALATIAEMRPVTHEALLHVERACGRPLWAIADALDVDDSTMQAQVESAS
eukprot:gnl/TRDRNA2_/TRDRNA2_83377_c0_seq1.p1 gnl/TRDRNA2_/TRDRNA2_83377_c0~~gnl/TRDRNA2_/TRDRNA2_83377_c0_seq1.p1  ORF type:complete len:312 (-),score=49.02 gnl/TRDRNA2_/TRDRNA2_83377_c0_seq1:50-985(-)